MPGQNRDIRLRLIAEPTDSTGAFNRLFAGLQTSVDRLTKRVGDLGTLAARGFAQGFESVNRTLTQTDAKLASIASKLEQIGIRSQQFARNTQAAIPIPGAGLPNSNALWASAYQRNDTLRQYARSYDIRQGNLGQQSERAIAGFLPGQSGIESQVTSLVDSLFRQDAAQQSAVAAAVRARASHLQLGQSSFLRNQELRGFYADDRYAYGRSGLSRGAEAEVGRFNPRSAGDAGIEEAINSIFRQNKTDTQTAALARKNAERAQRAADKIARGIDKEMDAFAKALEDLAGQETEAGEKSKAGDLAAQKARAAAAWQATLPAIVGNQRAALLAQGFSPSGQKLGYDASGNPTVLSEQFSRNPGFLGSLMGRGAGTASIDNSKGTVTAQIKEARSLWETFTSQIDRNGNVIQKSLYAAFHPLESVKGLVNSIGHEFVYLSATIYSVERVAHLASSAILGPFKAVLNASDESKKFRLAVAGTVGGLGQARTLEDSLIATSGQSSLTIPELRQVGLGMSKIPYLAGGLSSASPSAVSGQVGSFADTVARFGVLNPGQSTESIIHALEAGLEGNMRSMRTDLKVDLVELATLVGRNSQKAFIGDPGLLLKAAGQYAQRYTSDEALAERRKTLSFQVENLSGLGDLALKRIGDSHVFDDVVGRFQGLADSLFKYLESSAFRARADAIGKSLADIFDHVTDAGLALLKNLTGKQDLQGTADGVAEAISIVTRKLADWTKDLPTVAGQAGGALRELIEEIRKFVADIKEIKDHPGAYIAGSLARDAIDYQYGAPFKIASGGNNYLNGAKSWLEQKAVGLGANLATGPSLDERVREAAVNFLAGAAGGGSGGPATRPSAAAPPAYAKYGLPSDLKGLFETVPGGFKDPRSGQNVFAGLMKEATRSIGEIGESFEDESDKLYATTRKATAAMNRLFDPNGESAFTRLAEQLDLQVAGIDATINKLKEEQAKDPAHGKDIGNYISTLRGARGQAFSQYASERTDLVKGIQVAGRNLGLGIAQNLSGESATTRELLLSQILSGNLPQQQQIRERMAASGINVPLNFGLNSFEPFERNKVLREYLDAASSRNRAAAGFGGPLSYSQSAAEIIAHAQSPLSDRAGAQLQINLLQRMLPALQSNYEFLASAAQRDGSFENIRSANNAAELLASQVEQLRKAKLGVDDLTKSWIEFGATARGALENSLGSAITNLIEGTGSLRDVLVGFAHDIVQSFGQLASRNLLQSLLGDALKPQSSGQAGGLGGLLGQLFGTSTAAAANGGEFNGSFVPMRAFAFGGVASSPTFGLIAERPGMQEAVVPMIGGRIPFEWGPSGPAAVLPGGRRVPASMVGGGGGTVVHNHTIVVSDRAAADREAASIRAVDPEAIISVVDRDLSTGGRLAKRIKRMPG